jgi:transcriptional regulator of acetoin/glycerol metabolism
VAAPDGRLLGVLDISGDRRSAHPHTFCLVRTAAQMIENRLFEARHGADIRLRLHPLAEGIGTLAEGVLAVTEDGRIAGANRAALALLGLDAADLGTKPLALVLDLRLADLLDWGRRRPGEPLAVRMAGGGGLYLRVEPGRLALSLGLGSRTGRLPVPAPPPADALAAIDTGDTRTAAAVARVRRILAKPIPLLLLGESGVGKERFAAAVHRSGPRRAGPFVAVNCGALPEHLIESELFGYAPGAFTGARREGSAGRIRAAQGGTLFLDEIGDMPLGLQARLLRVLQEREVSPLGGARPVPVDFALTCATHHNLKAEMEAGRFRADLYYRINGLTLILPCLRERSDFAVLLARLIEEEAPGRGLALAPDLARAFAAYPWPGNLRQLANAVQIACALLDEGETQIGWQHLPDDLAADLASPPTPVPCAALGAGAGAGPGANLRALSDAAIRRTVADAGGNLSEAARRLGISRNTLYRRLRPAAAP